MTSNQRTGNIDLPPKPDPLTGEPHPPHAPREWPGSASESERDPHRFGTTWPKEVGPLLECFVPGGRNKFTAATLLMLAMAGGITLISDGFGWLTSWWAWLCILAFGPIGYLTTRGGKCAAGAEWFQHRSRWVRQYELTSVKIRMRFSNRYLHLKDRDGRKVAVFTGDVQQNQRLWDLLYNGILHSVVADGAETNWIARRALKLPKPTD
jgi:hypothetical protein